MYYTYHSKMDISHRVIERHCYAVQHTMYASFNFPWLCFSCISQKHVNVHCYMVWVYFYYYCCYYNDYHTHAHTHTRPGAYALEFKRIELMWNMVHCQWKIQIHWCGNLYNNTLIYRSQIHQPNNGQRHWIISYSNAYHILITVQYNYIIILTIYIIQYIHMK